MEGPDDSSQASGRRRSKVARLIDEYGLEGLDAELERLWTAEENRLSLRELADYFNRQLLRARMDVVEMQPLEGEAENLYRLLTDGDVSSGTRIEAERQLEREGIDVDALMGDFVSHQAIHTYLTKHREVTAPASNSGVESSRESVQRLENRTGAVVENTLSTLRNREDLDLPKFDVFVDIRVTCQACHTQHEVIELLEQGGCDCTT